MMIQRKTGELLILNPRHVASIVVPPSGTEMIVTMASGAVFELVGLSAEKVKAKTDAIDLLLDQSCGVDTPAAFSEAGAKVRGL